MQKGLLQLSSAQIIGFRQYALEALAEHDVLYRSQRMW